MPLVLAFLSVLPVLTAEVVFWNISVFLSKIFFGQILLFLKGLRVVVVVVVLVVVVVVEFCTIFGGRTKSVRMPLMVSMGTLNLGGLSGTRTGLPEEAAKARDWLLGGGLE